MNQETIDGIRKYHGISHDELTDDQIKYCYKGSFGESIVNLKIAKNNLKNEIIKVLPNWMKL